jgi:hypothetical protein
LSATKSSVLVDLIKLLTHEVQNCGLKIVTTICDQGRQANQAAINILLKESDKERGQQSRRRIITVENQSIIPLYDPPHLIKGIRNNLLFINK